MGLAPCTSASHSLLISKYLKGHPGLPSSSHPPPHCACTRLSTPSLASVFILCRHSQWPVPCSRIPRGSGTSAGISQLAYRRV